MIFGWRTFFSLIIYNAEYGVRSQPKKIYRSINPNIDTSLMGEGYKLKP